MANQLVSHLSLLALRAGFFVACRRYLGHFDLKRLAHPPPQKQPEPAAPPEQAVAPAIAALIFCCSFCEGSLLFSIVILGSWLSPQARNLNWNFSLALLISSVVFIVPFLESLLFSTTLLSRRRKTNERIRILSARTLGLTLVPFGVYLVVYYRLGQVIQGLLGVESGSHSFGFLNTTLARICVPGVILIASLSGGGAVNTAWLTWEWRRRAKEPPITDQHIVAAEKSLLRTQNDLVDRRSILHQQQASLANSSKPDGSSLLTTLFTSSSHPKTTQLQQEVAGLEAMEAQMISDISVLKERKESHEYSRTIPGMMLNIANWFLSVYCVYRLFMACVNLIFGYVKHPTTTTTRNPTTDVVTYLVAKVLATFSIELEIGKLTRLVGLVLIGSIIVVNLRAVLVWVNRVFNRLSVSSTNPSGLGSSLILLVLAQLMAIYLLTCLISLPSSSPAKDPSTETPPNVLKEASLLDTLPSFSRFSKLFDLVFLATGTLTFLFRWLLNQICLPPDTPSTFIPSSSSSAPNGEENIQLNQRIGAHFV
ncbi:hypothetical protein PTTG_04857 [Puccinia triticina 1-1 BBBD Race 1]|uniref:Abscisic acid G-protein coupled receptor-like domain-containing protein n=1 Tax=Puccinia triticina (isolate 1-1 / race 1 (BBBD)) TaxID=630390 RepID=A0A180GEW6_PUCT1|nr:hypothetical protein PTTG_04857 [Puccinia triticina 1-1 BBBD Race 1]